MIKKETIDKIFETARVEEVIGDFVNLKRAGSNLKGYSPFNDEKSPSFMVSPSKQIWKDFSSGKGGNVVKFLMEHERMTYPEALRWLAKRYHIEIEEVQENTEEKQKRSEIESMHIVLDYAKKWYSKQLLESNEGKSVGLGYFKNRGFREETLKTFETGYAPERKDAFTQSALKKGYKLEFLIKTGLTIQRGDQTVDRFRGRIMFPIHSLSGRVLGFGGRILNSQLKTAKYINSPESEVYHKGKVLYGIYQAKQSIVKNDQCLLVEGYTDVMALHQAGIKNVVASSGTALTSEQIRLIKRLTSNILVIFDGDPAGIRAAFRGIDMILEEGLNVKVLPLPQGEDPDSFSKQISSEELMLYLEEKATDFIRFKTDLLQKESANDPIKKAELVKNIVQSIAKIPQSIKQEIYIQEVARIMNVSEETLFKELALIQRHNIRKIEKDFIQKKRQESLKPITKKKEKTKTDKRTILEKNIIKYLLLYGNKTIEIEDWEIIEDDSQNRNTKEKKPFPYNEMPKIKKHTYETSVAHAVYLQMQEDEMTFANPVFKKLYNIIIPELLNGKTVDFSKLQAQADDEISVAISDILMEEEKYQLADWEKHGIEIKSIDEVLPWSIPDITYNIRRIWIKELINEKKELLKNEENEENLQDLLEEIQEYLLLFKLISLRLNRPAI